MPNSQHSGDSAVNSFEPVSPIDIVQPNRRSGGPVNPHSNPSTSSSSPPRTLRFTEATSAVSPIESSTQSPFSDPPAMAESSSEPKVSDLGFGYVADNQPSNHASAPIAPQSAGLRSNPPQSPLKSAMKVPGTPGRFANPLSPTFKEEQILEYHEKKTEEENAKDVVCHNFPRFPSSVDLSCRIFSNKMRRKSKPVLE